MMYPYEKFRETRRERFEQWFSSENFAGRSVPLDKNTAWVTWQDCEELCCNAFHDQKESLQG